MNITLAPLTLLVGEDIGWAELIITGLVGQHPEVVNILYQPERGSSARTQRATVLRVVRMVRAGRRVVMTTYSDIIAQQVNNFIKLGTLRVMGASPTEGGLPYGPDDYLLPEDVVAYDVQFGNDRHLVATELEKRPTGIVMTPFNREIDAQAREIELLNDLIQTRQEPTCSP